MLQLILVSTLEPVWLKQIKRGAIAAAQSIRIAGSTHDLVILVDETITEYHRSGLEAAGWKIQNPKAEKDAYNEWNYSKFRLWQLTDYDKIIFIEKANFSDGHWRINKRLKKCIDRVCSWKGMQRNWEETNWTDEEAFYPSPPSICLAQLPRS